MTGKVVVNRAMSPNGLAAGPVDSAASACVTAVRMRVAQPCAS
jgi:hypothetical protein